METNTSHGKSLLISFLARLELSCTCAHYTQDILDYLRREFKNSETSPPGTSGVRSISWYGIRYMITEVSPSMDVL